MILNILRARDTDSDANAFLVEMQQHKTVSPGEKTEHQKIRDHFLLPETELILKSMYFRKIDCLTVYQKRLSFLEVVLELCI